MNDAEAKEWDEERNDTVHENGITITRFGYQIKRPRRFGDLSWNFISALRMTLQRKKEVMFGFYII